MFSNIENFSTLLSVARGYAFIKAYKIKVIATSYACYFVDTEYEFYVELSNDEIYERDDIVSYLKSIYDNYLDALGEWKDEQLINGKLVRHNVGVMDGE